MGRCVVLLALSVSVMGAGCGGDSGKAVGSEGGACYANDTCNAGLECLSHLCVKRPGDTDVPDGHDAADGNDTSGGADVPEGTDIPEGIDSLGDSGPDPVADACGDCGVDTEPAETVAETQDPGDPDDGDLDPGLPEADTGGGELAGDRCDTATLVSLTGGMATLVGQTTAGYANDYNGGTGCANSSTTATGPDRVYQVTLEPGKRFSATLTPSGWDATLSLVEGLENCASIPRICLVGLDSGTVGTAEFIRYVNTTAMARTLYLVIDGYMSNNGEFSLEIVVDNPPTWLNPGDTCQFAPAISAGPEIAGSTVGYAANYGAGTGCQGTNGVDGVYVVSVPPEKSLTATVTPTTTWDPSISLVLGPAANCDATPRVCLASDDSGGASVSNHVVYANTSGNFETVFIVIDTTTPGPPGGEFVLAISLQDAR